MVYSIMQQDNDISYDIVQYVVNKRNDVAEVPTTNQPGSTVLCIEDSSVWMLTVDVEGQKEWKEI